MSINKYCLYTNELKNNPNRNVFLLLGIGAFIAIVFIIIYFLGERLGIFPMIQVSFVAGLSEGESWILFITMVFVLFTLGLLLTGIIAYHGFKRECRKSQLK